MMLRSVDCYVYHRRFGTTCRFLLCFTSQKSADLVVMVPQLPDHVFQITPNPPITNHPNLNTEPSHQLPHTNHQSEQNFLQLLSPLVSPHSVAAIFKTYSPAWSVLTSHAFSSFMVLIGQFQPAQHFSHPPTPAPKFFPHNQPLSQPGLQDWPATQLTH